jgi:6-phosphogluconolactonase/glucosamine-6-phosphate isomerase/deaminase
MANISKQFAILKALDVPEAAQMAGESLGKILVSLKEAPVLLMLSGGSALKILDFVDEEALGGNLTITVLDERFSGDPLVNNFSQLQGTNLYIKALEKEANFIGTLPRKDDTAEILAARLESALRNWRRENPEGKIVATLGMGPDGHTAGIMPFPEEPEMFKKLFDNKKWVASYDAGNKNPFRLRLTATLPFLRTIDQAVGFIVGEEKKPAFNRLLLKRGNLTQLPALVFWDIKNLQIFTDFKAAG